MRSSLLALLVALCAVSALANDPADNASDESCQPTLLGVPKLEISEKTRQTVKDIWKRVSAQSEARAEERKQARIREIELEMRQYRRDFFLALPPSIQADVLIQPRKEVRVTLTPRVWAALGDGLKAKILDDAAYADENGFVSISMDATNRIEDAPLDKEVWFGPVATQTDSLTPISELPRRLREFARGMREKMQEELTLSPGDSDGGEELRPVFSMRVYEFPNGQILGGEIRADVRLRLDGESNGQWQTDAYFDADLKLLNPDATYSFDH